MQEHVLQRVLLEWLKLDPVATPSPCRALWPHWTDQDKQQVKLRVLSLNAWGLPVAPKCTERAVNIANAISNAYDLVVLQEIWHVRERNLIIAKAQKNGFHYYHYFNSAVGFPFPMGADSFGTGLLVLSTFPVSSALYHSFGLSGRPYALHESDFIANKGVGLLRVETPAGQIDVYATHLLANYNSRGEPGPGDFYQSHRVGQSYELTQFILATSRSDLTIVCGDFNSSPDCLELKVPRQLLCLRDAYTDTNDDENGLTFASPDNKYSHGEHPMRMDYVMYRINRQHERESNWHLVKSSIFKEFFIDARGDTTPLSDHFGVSAEFVFSEARPHICERKAVNAEVLPLDGKGSLKATVVAHSCPTTTCSYCDKQEQDQSEEEKAAADVACLREVLNMLLVGRNGAIMARRTRLWRAVAFFAAALAVCVTHVMSIMVSRWSWAAVLLFGIISVAEYILTFFFLTFECSTFTELTNEVQLDLHVHTQRKSERLRAKARKA